MRSGGGPARTGEPVRVLNLIARLNVGGPARHAAWLMAGLDKERFRQWLVTGRVGDNEDDLGPWVRSLGVEYRELPGLGRDINPLRDLLVLWRLLVILSRLRPHIVATHTAKAGFLGRLACLLYSPWASLTGRPIPRTVHTFHGHTFHGYFGHYKNALFLTLERLLSRFATWRIVTISPAQRREILEKYRVGRPDNLVVLPLGMDLDLFQNPQAGRAAFREELGAGDGEFLVGIVGRVAPVKDHGLFLETAAFVKEKRPDLYAKTRFLVIGGGGPEDMTALDMEKHRLKVADRVEFLGNRGDPERFHPGLDCLMLTSRNEGTPFAILEAGAVGRPVLARAVGGVPDLLGPVEESLDWGLHRRSGGLTVSGRNPGALGRGLIRLMEDPALAASLGAGLRGRVEETYDRRRMLTDVERLYLED